MNDPTRSKIKIGILVPAHPAPNMNAVLENFGQMIQDEVTLNLVQAGKDIPYRLRNHYDVYQYHLFHGDPIGFGSTMRACFRYASRERPDLLMNAAQPQTLGFIVSVVGRRLGIHSLVRMTGETFKQDELARTWIARIKVALLHGIMARFAYSYASSIVTVGQSLRESLLNKGYDLDKIHVLPQPFDADLFQPKENANKKSNLKHELGLRDDALTILFVGRLSWLKGADRLIEIIDRVTEVTNKYQFCIIGHGEYLELLERYPSSKVIVTGSISHNDMRQYYLSADILLFPSRTEGLPNVVLEALASRLPIIATPVGEIPHYVSNLAETEDEFVHYIINENWKVDNLPTYFEWQNQKQHYIALYNSLIYNQALDIPS